MVQLRNSMSLAKYVSYCHFDLEKELELFELTMEMILE